MQTTFLHHTTSYLRHLATHTTRDLYVFDKDGHALAVNRLEFRVFKQMRQVRQAGSCDKIYYVVKKTKVHALFGAAARAHQLCCTRRQHNVECERAPAPLFAAGGRLTLTR